MHDRTDHPARGFTMIELIVVIVILVVAILVVGVVRQLIQPEWIQALAGRNVTINNLLPGAFDTDRLRVTLQGAAAKSGQSIEQVAAARRALAEEIVRVRAVSLKRSIAGSKATPRNVAAWRASCSRSATMARA